MNCDADIQEIINKQKELIDTIDNYNYYMFCKKVGNTQNIGNDGTNGYQAYDFDITNGTYKMYNTSEDGGWPQELIDISNNLRTGCQNPDLKGFDINTIEAKIDELQTEINNLENDTGCSDKIQEIRDKHVELMNKKQQVLNLTAQYESDPESMLKQSELQLDSTIYASILWSTVAAGLLYYVFVDI